MNKALLYIVPAIIGGVIIAAAYASNLPAAIVCVLLLVAWAVYGSLTDWR